MSDIFDYIINKKPENQFLTGTISSLSPLQVKLFPADSAISCKSTTGLIGLKVGSNVILLKIGNQFIVTHVIGNSIESIKYIKKSSNETRNNSTTHQNDNDFVNISLKESSIFEIEAILSLLGPGSGNGQFSNTWAVTGGASQLTKRSIVACANASAIWDGNVTMHSKNLNENTCYSLDPTNESSAREKFLIQTTTAGTITLKWAQYSAYAGNTILTANSYMKITELKEY